MAKKKKAPVLDAWCWYCDREFEDEKVLLQHQKAKHYRCPQCPRRLNTAGGLTVHLAQVHKAEPGKIENALPGRESFDIEIYGMVGIPPADLAEWQSRRGAGAAQGGGGAGGQPSAKRQKVEKVALSAEQLKAQLEAHKALMSGKSAAPAAVPPPVAPPAMPTQFAPPMNYAGPPPGFAPPFSPYATYSGPPPSFPPPAAAAAAPAPAPAKPHPHTAALASGAKSRMVYVDETLSPEEKLALQPKYRFPPAGPSSAPDVKPAAAAPAPAAVAYPSAASPAFPPPGFAAPPPGFSGPPPGFASPAAAAGFASPPPGFAASPPPGFAVPPPGMPPPGFGSPAGYGTPPQFGGPPPGFGQGLPPGFTR
ncbi:hypothetical protein FA09DRAFT_314881 [Tilletiopsis washingtonensis]|uniref:C2H2-type domain-containing protein n=1 Tax=Tilletiopsis washingtonensis TaxID=58919 RepID=A0A316ZFH8_9BASI|nr:hypothetical protein FA09DRAFT_314881 [Tilletiopsis washingtonensis]PWO00280.1 hypothetical protein FA09DRAFT_314881 [Tilletiopsis washingtonensis]